MPESKFPFLSSSAQFVEMNLLQRELRRSVLGLSPWSLSRATELILHYAAYLSRPCVYVQHCTRFPLTLGSEKLRLSLASSVEQTTALAKYLPAPALSQLAQVDFRAKVQMRPGACAYDLKLNQMRTSAHFLLHLERTNFLK